MSVKTEYKQQVDAFCQENVKVTGEELLLLAKERSKKEPAEKMVKGENVIDFTAHKRSRGVWKKYLSVACIIILCSMALTTTTLAATGMLGDVLRKLFKDETSAKLVEEGFAYEANQSGTDGIFRVDFLGVTGDKSAPKMFFDVYVEDTELAEDYDEIGLWVSTYGRETPESEETEFWFPAYGVKDEENENLYHVVREGGTVRMPSGQPMRVVVTNVIFNPDQMDMVNHEVNIEFTMDVPSTALHTAKMEYYGGLRFNYGGCDYYLNYVTYSVYHTELSVVFYYDGESFEGKYTDKYQLERLLQPYWNDFISEVVFVVDGVEYGILDSEEGYGYVGYSDSTEAGDLNKCYVNPRFPAIDYDGAKDIRIRQGETEYRVK